ncbi:MAG: hypothetical protein IKQ29_03655 [Bacilli bacterium]|nr:hypothetical protein [Bacilli bacterium]
MWFYIKQFFKRIWNFLVWSLKWIVAIAFVALILFGIYIGINDIKAGKAKDYLVEEYNLDSYKMYAYKTTEFVYEENVDCSTLWFKKCTDDVDKDKEITFILLEKGFPRIHVTVYKDGTYVDDYGNKDSKKDEEEKKDN